MSISTRTRVRGGEAGTLSVRPGSKTRTVTFIDREAPILTLVGEPEFVVEASTEGSYVELGATCHDYVGGDITPARVITADFRKGPEYMRTYRQMADSTGGDEFVRVHVAKSGCNVNLEVRQME